MVSLPHAGTEPSPTPSPIRNQAMGIMPELPPASDPVVKALMKVNVAELDEDLRFAQPILDKLARLALKK